MNKSDINVLKEAISDYCEGLFGISLNYMKLNGIDYNLTGDDDLSVLLRRATYIKKSILIENDFKRLEEYKNELLFINDGIRKIIG